MSRCLTLSCKCNTTHIVPALGRLRQQDDELEAGRATRWKLVQTLLTLCIDYEMFPGFTFIKNHSADALFQKDLLGFQKAKKDKRIRENSEMIIWVNEIFFSGIRILNMIKYVFCEWGKIPKNILQEKIIIKNFSIVGLIPGTPKTIQVKL
jgi:hypothetical protein